MLKICQKINKLITWLTIQFEGKLSWGYEGTILEYSNSGSQGVQYSCIEGQCMTEKCPWGSNQSKPPNDQLQHWRSWQQLPYMGVEEYHWQVVGEFWSRIVELEGKLERTIEHLWYEALVWQSLIGWQKILELDKNKQKFWIRVVY